MAASEPIGITSNFQKTFQITLKKQLLRRCFTACLRDVRE